MPSDTMISNYILEMGLSISLAIYIAFRAGRRLRGLTPETFEEKISDFTFDSLRQLIADKLEELLAAQDIRLPGKITITQVADHRHSETEDLALLQTTYDSLMEQAAQSPYYIEALSFIMSHF